MEPLDLALEEYRLEFLVISSDDVAPVEKNVGIREKRASFFLFQSISMAIQRGNASCVIGTVPHSEGLEEIFEFVTNHKTVNDDEESQKFF